MADNIELQVQERKVSGKRTRYLRREGVVPAHLYGPGAPSKSLQVDSKGLAHLMSTTGRTTMITLTQEGNGKGEQVFLWNVQRHPVTDDVIHVDFFKPDLKKPIRSKVPIHMTGESPARREGAVVVLSLAMLEIEALPGDIPKGIEADISSLEHINQHLLVRDLKVPATVTVVSPPEQAVVRAAPPRKEEEVVKPTAVAAAAPGAEGAAAATAAAPGAEGAPAAGAKPAVAAGAKPAAAGAKPAAKAPEAKK